MRRLLGHRRHRDEGGQGLVEFALILPVLLLMMLGIIDVGRILYIYSSLTNASREASRYGIANGISSNGSPYFLDCAGIRASAERIAFLVGLADGDIQIDYDRDNGSGSTAVLYNCDGSGHPKPTALAIVTGDRIKVTVTKTIHSIVPLANIPPLTVQSVTARTITKDVTVDSQ